MEKNQESIKYINYTKKQQCCKKKPCEKDRVKKLWNAGGGQHNGCDGNNLQ